MKQPYGCFVAALFVNSKGFVMVHDPNLTVKVKCCCSGTAVWCQTLAKRMTFDDRAAPTKPWGWDGSCRNLVSRGIRPSGPKLICWEMVCFSQSQKVRVSPYELGTAAGLNPCITTLVFKHVTPTGAEHAVVCSPALAWWLLGNVCCVMMLVLM